MSRGPVKFFQNDKSIQDLFYRELGLDRKLLHGYEWLFNFTGRVESCPKLRIVLLDSVRYEFQKMNHVCDGLWGIKIVLTPGDWTQLYKASGEYQLVLELMLYNKTYGKQQCYELFKLPCSFLPGSYLYNISRTDILNEKIYNSAVKVVKPDTSDNTVNDNIVLYIRMSV